MIDEKLLPKNAFYHIFQNTVETNVHAQLTLTNVHALRACYRRPLSCPSGMIADKKTAEFSATERHYLLPD